MDFDVVIVGGGLAGLALAVALRDSRLSVALVEGRVPIVPDGWDSRIYAISPANARFLDSIGIWRHMNVDRMVAVQAMEIHGGAADGRGRLDFSAYDSGVSELAWIVEQSLMQRELWESAKRQGNLELVCPAHPAKLEMTESHRSVTLADGRRLTTQLIVAADGADSWTRAAAGIDITFKPYGQLGVVANFFTEKPHRGTAFQWFRDDGILAWLPLPGNQISMVWSTLKANADELLSLEAEDLARRVEAAGSGRLGKLDLMTPAAGFPLRLMRAPKMVLQRFALIGDAAHAIHPLSGHGINLGFQDAATLAGVLKDKPDHIDAGDLSLLRAYERARKEEIMALQGVTDGLQQLFGSTAASLTALRSFGLNLTNQLPVVKDALVRYALAS
jgi:ubiquinone biosynthesis UbiH/UbiF/VisC/COQ6 family hydroxylase